MIDYKTNYPISVKQFIELLNKTTLGARRPLEDEKRVAAMLYHADLLVTAWDGERLVGVARSVTDFAYCCYLSDLAVDEQYQKQGITFLQKELKVLDPIQYQQMDIYNPQRMIRALEVCIVAGKPYSSFLNKKATTRDFQTIQIGLTADRAIVYNRIEERVEVMLEKGLLIEAQEMFRYRKLNALQTVGYRELFDFLDGKMSLAIAVEEIKKNTRRFAKRQYTWFNKDEDIQWFDYEIAVEEIITVLKENG